MYYIEKSIKTELTNLSFVKREIMSKKKQSQAIRAVKEI